MTLQRSDLLIVVEMDSLEAVTMISCEVVDRSIYASIMKEIKYLLSLRQTCITHVSRSQNKASHSLAMFARSEGRTMTWLELDWPPRPASARLIEEPQDRLRLDHHMWSLLPLGDMLRLYPSCCRQPLERARPHPPTMLPKVLIAIRDGGSSLGALSPSLMPL